ncbi:DNA-directed RNA polymerase I subunit RPA2 [Agyrium rufum]|nr:DNA-directed RNA polymerase I subunit RPA2 [Agyrium rufum]
MATITQTRAPTKTKTKWTTEFDTVRREKLFRHPPKDRTAYPLLQEAFRPHIESFNALFHNDNHLQHALEDIGTKTFFENGETDEQRLAREAQGEPASPRNKISVRLSNIYLERPRIPPSNKFCSENKRKIYPSECRERHASYRGRLTVKLEYRINNEEWKSDNREMGQLPIMLRSNRCYLESLPPAQMVQHKEETEEFGGYFIVNGNEKLIRLLIMPKRNFPMAIIRTSFVKRGDAYTKFGIQMRCVRPDQTSQTNVLHYLEDGMVTFRFSWRKNEYLVPVVLILRALMETNDREICEGLVGMAGSKGAKNTFLTDRVELLLRSYKSYPVGGKYKTRTYLGSKFRPVFDVPENATDEQAGTEFLRKVVLVHLGNVNVTESQDRDKFQVLIFMIRKLYALVAGDCAVDNPDAVSNQEVLLGGFFYGMIIKEKLEDWLSSIGLALREYTGSSPPIEFTSPKFDRFFLSRILRKTTENIASKLEYFLSTGNLATRSGLDMQQVSGYTVVAEKINFYRFVSHFRMIHRGSFFAQLKTTTVRKLLPESWGFLCPVHTPDGSPCGLLNHLAHMCKILTRNSDVSKVSHQLAELGVSPDTSSSSTEDSVMVQLDGRIIGSCSPKQARIIADTLRYWKVEGSHDIPLELEIGYVPNSNGGQYPGIYMFSQSSRFIRPVQYLPHDKIDYVGPFEQPYMSIAVTHTEIQSGENTHVEIAPTNILSIVANQTPFSDFNQSPRNMYQCQMGKQAMGTPGTTGMYRTDNKSYQLQTGQTPIVRPPLYNTYGLDNFPNGMNAVVAVISYTGYDMDDAMILNKSAHERGFGHGTIYKTKIIRLAAQNNTTVRGISKMAIKSLFGFAPESMVTAAVRNHLDDDGLPRIGSMVNEGDVLYSTFSVNYDAGTDNYVNLDYTNKLEKYKDTETAYVEEVRLLGAETGDMPCQTLSIKLRIPRSPVIGDKFSSRHGQKGVCSQKWPAADMPFSESGIVPDVIINPHAFPSRMTIGMFMESLAGKSGALHGLAQDCSPWTFDEENTAGDFFGEQLVRAGYNFYGNEPMYSGITGQEFAADIYVGVVFYQRLRHMVNDKFQVRTTGPVDPLTGQPIKGRAKGGGIRVGEMERDALLAHGCAFLLQDRLLNCSDYMRAWACKGCGSFLSTQMVVQKGVGVRKGGSRGSGIVRCRRCAVRLVDIIVRDADGNGDGEDTAPGAEKRGRVARNEGLINGYDARKSALIRKMRKDLDVDAAEDEGQVWEDGQGEKWVGGDDVRVLAIPGVLKYLDVELAAMGIRLKFDIGP